MCGIFGTINYKLDYDMAKRCLDTLEHRGPDGEGIWQKDNVTLGHRRLSILDLSNNGKQPMSYANDRYYITYNGEIFNFIEIREELKNLGYTFMSDSDTEVVLAAFCEWGEACQLKFNGMWAFAIWDAKERRLFLSRDRFGVKPLFYTRFGQNGLAFASEMKALCPLMQNVTANKELFEFYRIHQHYEMLEECLINGISRLRAGYCAWVENNGSMTINRWWNTLEHLVEVPDDYNEQVTLFRELFIDSCKMRMRSDVTIGTALSGGLDSSSTIAVMAHLAQNGADSRMNNDWQHAYVAHFSDSVLNETNYASMVTDYLGIQKTLVEINPVKAVNNMTQYMYMFEELWSTNPISMMLLYQKEKEDGVTVSIDGHAADELFGGYNFDIIHAIVDTGFDFKAVDDIFSAYYGMEFRESQKRQHGFAEKAQTYLSLKTKAYVKKVIHRPTQATIFENEKAWQRLDELNKRLYISTHETILPTLLRNYDRYSMANGVEIRMPFLDYRLVQLAFSVNWSSKVRNGYTKAIVRDAVAPFLPQEVVYRKSKIGWTTPIGEIMQSEARTCFADMCHSADFDNCDLINPKAARDKIMLAINGDKDEALRYGIDAWEALQPYIWEQAMIKRAV